ncbi:CPBP family intramembrane glutamic endopeptidase [Nostoc sp. CMAA1605]|uniref:CPBP family intramembrane glutamic endopeptidase n=1 Tax=Nostoc sp. CMAA1605 TaxID=2055159 RepID=UPI001F341A6E|nr:type II CAAX endopeptidase family protein [Nostoc sp. CMAA1605]MCF4966263.1 CPBP family intramembrane metalloprotease [Nostoc sp. CMAA1605]
MKINLMNLAQRPAPIRLGCFILVLLLLWLPIAAPIYLLVDDSNRVSIITMVVLYVEFIFLLRFWGQKVYQQPQILKLYGLKFTRRNGVELLFGFILGIINIFILFGAQSLLGWLVWQSPKIFLPKLILEGLLVGIGVGFAEELLFRGWLLDELQRDYTQPVALWTDALIFAALHFIKPLAAIIETLPQFPALVLLGLTQVWGKRWRRGLLGLPIGLHGGLVGGYYIINVGGLSQYSGRVPNWVTGVNNNPLQGLMGVFFMSILAIWMWRRSVKG